MYIEVKVTMIKSEPVNNEYTFFMLSFIENYFRVMGTTNINQLMGEMRQLVLNLQNREKSTDSALSKSQLVSEKISGMKEVRYL